MQELIGKIVKYDVMNNVGLVIIKANTPILQEHLDLAKRHRINTTDIILDNGIVFATSSSNPMSPINLMTRHVVDQSIRLFRSIEFNKEIPVAEIEKTILPTVQKISNDANIFNLFEAVRAKDDYTHQHNIGVAVLATLLGKWLKISGDDLATLSLAAILHDVGKVKIPVDLLNKVEKLTVEEYKIIQQHTVLGYQMLRETPELTHQIASVALQHHEKENGSGYPLGLKGNKIDLFSKIVTVADIFHAMSSKRPYHDPIPFHSIVKQMKEGIFGELEPQIVSVFLRNITRKLVGTQVVLMDGRIGEIVYINPHDELKPMVKINDLFIDLSKERHLHIKEIVC
ncbi:HD-GYP domain-containing protein [Paenibacillus psychroresistens]|uniref:HD-GYP domain-containing protein n=1 Tax=Paenibacillus psychroresistens TaxID=1778678 RepID=A0A6B8RKG1_9BACL|nr:HD-GYP domain-containing protein [Paenibacillus psychroresistens]QGQ95906.1 HD-GYP domain-containing protein [Paenibacillus psychroresistens]